MMRFCLVFLLLIAASGGARAWGAPVFKDCASARERFWCLSGQEQIREQLAAARKGDYQAMRNVAFCLETGCDGGFVIDRPSGCAIRREIMQRHGRKGGKVDGGDEASFARCVREGNL